MRRGLIVVPACNEAVCLEHFLPRLKGVIQKIPNTDIDIVVIDDGSTDATTKVVTKKGCRLVRNDQNRGLGYSLRRGYQLAVDEKRDFLVSMDSDGQHDVKLLKTVIDHLANGVDLVTASRYHLQSERYNPPIDRDLLNVAFTAIIHAVTGWKHLTDPLTGFWAMNARLTEFLASNIRLERYGSCLEALIKLWYLCDPRPVLAEVPHPAIYANTAGGILNRIYSPSQLEERVDRFGTHALHVVSALQDVQAAGHEIEIEDTIGSWRKSLLSHI